MLLCFHRRAVREATQPQPLPNTIWDMYHICATSPFQTCQTCQKSTVITDQPTGSVSPIEPKNSVCYMPSSSAGQRLRGEDAGRNPHGGADHDFLGPFGIKPARVRRTVRVLRTQVFSCFVRVWGLFGSPKRENCTQDPPTEILSAHRIYPSTWLSSSFQTTHVCLSVLGISAHARLDRVDLFPQHSQTESSTDN